MVRLPIIAVLDDRSVLVFDHADEVLATLETIDIENDEYTFYDSTGHLLKYEVTWERPGRTRRFLCLTITDRSKEVVKFYDHEPPLDRTAQMRQSLEFWLSLPVFNIPEEWVHSASIEELIAKIRQLPR
jgi:hypothetical protein